MTDPIIIEREELYAIVDRAIAMTLIELGIKPKKISPWMSQNKATHYVGRVRLYNAMQNGTVKWKKQDMNNPRSRVWILKKDIDKLIREPYLINHYLKHEKDTF